MKLTELSLAPTQFVLGKSTSSSSSESENNPSRKRKFLSDQHLLRNGGSPIQASVDLHVRDYPLPLDWEQCLDLQSGRMYYLNRKTLRKSWNWPKNQKLDLELNISSSVVSNCLVDQSSSFDSSVEASDKIHAPSNSNMVALACLNCHLLVILSKSSPSCPNCKHVHSLPTLQSPLLKVSPSKSLSTLSLMN